jgi:UDP-N-acetylglucosamine 3-dehydrogenase
MNIGILGTGFAGRTHARAMMGLEGVAVKGIAGRDAAKTERIARELGLEPYASAEALIAGGEVEGIVLCAPSSEHARLGIEALRAGKHLLCETPVAYSVEEAELMKEAAVASGRVLAVALIDRFQAPYRRVREIARSGELGRPVALAASRRSPSTWTSEDICVNLMIHDIDFACWLLGLPEELFCLGARDGKGRHASAQALLRYAGASVAVEGTTAMPPSYPFSTSLRAVFERGALELDWCFGERGPEFELRLYPESGKPELIAVEDYDPFAAECRYFVDAAQGRADPALSGIGEACASLRAAAAARESLRSGGRPVALD